MPSGQLDLSLHASPIRRTCEETETPWFGMYIVSVEVSERWRILPSPIRPSDAGSVCPSYDEMMSSASPSFAPGLLRVKSWLLLRVRSEKCRFDCTVGLSAALACSKGYYYYYLGRYLGTYSAGGFLQKCHPMTDNKQHRQPSIYLIGISRARGYASAVCTVTQY